MTSNVDLPEPEDLDNLVPRLEAKRRELNISRSEFSQRAGKERTCWQKIWERNSDPPLSTIHDFVKVTYNADPDGPRIQRGRQASCLADGGGD